MVNDGFGDIFAPNGEPCGDPYSGIGCPHAGCTHDRDQRGQVAGLVMMREPSRQYPNGEPQHGLANPLWEVIENFLEDRGIPVNTAERALLFERIHAFLLDNVPFTRAE